MTLKRLFLKGKIMENTTEIGQFSDYYQAMLAKEILESNNIHSIITGISLSIIETNPDTRIRLIINAEEKENALELLASFFSENA